MRREPSLLLLSCFVLLQAACSSSSGGGTGSADGGGNGGSGGSSMTGAGGGNGTCGDLPACVATLFNAGCFPSTSAGPCTKSMNLTSTSGTFTYCFANHTKLVIVSDNATGAQVQTYSDADGTCFTETVVPNGPYTYLDPSGTAVGSGHNDDNGRRHPGRDSHLHRRQAGRRRQLWQLQLQYFALHDRPELSVTALRSGSCEERGALARATKLSPDPAQGCLLHFSTRRKRWPAGLWHQTR